MEIKWTKQDVDAAYLMGVINATVHKTAEDDLCPSVTILKKEIDRLRGLGFQNPSDAVLVIRKNYRNAEFREFYNLDNTP